MRPHSLLALAAVAFLTACSSGQPAASTSPAAPPPATSAPAQDASPTAGSGASSSAAPPSPEAPASPSATPAPPSRAASSPAPSASGGQTNLATATLDFEGFGPLKVGMTHKAALSAGLTVRNDGECPAYLTAPRLRMRGVTIEESAERITEVSLTRSEDGAVAAKTAGGAHVGMTIAQVKAVYGNRFRVEKKNGSGGPFQAGVVREGDRELMFIPAYGNDWQKPLSDGMKVQSITARQSTPDAFSGC